MHIFIYTGNKEESELIYPLAKENPGTEYHIFINNLSFDSFMHTSLSRLDNVHYVDFANLDLISLSRFGLFITTDTKATGANKHLIALLRIFSSLNTPIMKLQSSLKQEDCSSPIASHNLQWYATACKNSTSIGYPVYYDKRSEAKGEYILVITDFDNGNYSDRDICFFSHSVFEYVKKQTTASLIWKFIGESPSCDKLANHRNYYTQESARILIDDNDAMLDKIELTEAIGKAKIVITTPTMPRLLDCELLSTPVAIYNSGDCPQPLGNAATFSKAEELEKILSGSPAPLHTGKFSPYDNSAFTTTVKELYKEPTVNREQFLSAITGAVTMLKECSSAPAEEEPVAAPSDNKYKKKCKKYQRVIMALKIILVAEFIAILTLLLILFK